MKDFKLYTQFNFAKCVHLSLLSVPEGNLCSSPEGISDFIKPYLQELQKNCSMEFSTEQPDAQSELVEDYSFTIACITFLVYFD